MNYFITAAYLLFFIFLLYALRRYYTSALSPWFVIVIFITKIITGIIYRWIHAHYYNGGDTYTYFHYSQVLFNAMHKNPLDYIRLVFGPVGLPPEYLKMYIADPNFPTDASSYFIIRYNLLLLPISHGINTVHIIIYEFITLWGLIFLYKFFLPYMRGKELLLKGFIFFLPSVLFWCSGIHKDGFALTGLGLLLYGTDNVLKHPFKLSNALQIIIGVILLLFSRLFMCFLIVPCMVSYAVCIWFPKYKVAKWFLVHAVFFLIAFNIKNFYYFSQLNQHYDLLGYLIFKQNDFIDLTLSRANLPVPRLQHNYFSLFSSIPYALNHCLLRPHIFELTNVIQYPAAIENILIIIVIITAIIFFSLKKVNVNLLLFLLFYCFTQFVLIGITVTNIGALVRYRAIGILLFLIAMLLLINKDKLAKIKATLPHFIKNNI